MRGYVKKSVSRRLEPISCPEPSSGPPHRPAAAMAASSNNTEVFLGGNSSLSFDNPLLRNSSEEEVISIDKGIASQMPGLPFLIISSSVVLALICSKFLENITIDPGKTKREGDFEDTDSDKSNVDVPFGREEAVKSDLNRNLDLNFPCDKDIEVGTKS